MSLPSHWRWRDDPVESGPAVVFDVDGVISNAAGRQHLLEGPRRDWHAFFDACGGDDPLPDQVVLTELLSPGHTVILLTARPVRLRPITLDWLDLHGVTWDLLIMRDRDAWEASAVFKTGEVDELERRGFDLRLAFEDDHRNVDMYRERGIPCVYIHSGYY